MSSSVYLRSLSAAMLCLMVWSLASLTSGGDSIPAIEDSLIAPYEVPDIERISERLFRLGRIILDSHQRCLYIPGRVNMSKGLVELLACGERGKKHESVLVLEAAAEHVQVGLLLLGLEPIGGLRYQGDPRTPRGDSVWIWVEWKSDEDYTMVRGEDMVLDYSTGRSMQDTHWIFSGSRVVEGRFAAGIDQSIVTTFHDPFTIIDNPLPTGGDDTLYGANEKVVPEVGHAVTLIVKADQTRPIHLRMLARQFEGNESRSPDNEAMER